MKAFSEEASAQRLSSASASASAVISPAPMAAAACPDAKLSESSHLRPPRRLGVSSTKGQIAKKRTTSRPKAMPLLRLQYARDVAPGATRELEVDRAKLEGSWRMTQRLVSPPPASVASGGEGLGVGGLRALAAQAPCAVDASVGWSGLFDQEKSPPPLTPPRRSLRSRGRGNTSLSQRLSPSSARRTASVTSRVVARPPRSGVNTCAAVTRSIDRISRAAAVGSPR